MRISFEWLKEYVDLDASAEKVADVLTEIGHEVEAIEKHDDDFVLEVNITPNRPDCLSIFGIARELSAYYRLQAKFPEYAFAAETGELDFNINIQDPDLCNRYAGRIVKNVTIAPSPEWMRKRLEKCGIRSINNIVDITNYVLLELGHPLHAFDLKTLKGNRIIIGTPETVKGKGVRLKTKTLDGVEREIPGNSLLIWDAEEPVAIAGVMGGLDTEVNENTKDIFIESAYFDPTSIRKTSKALGLKTESSFRFERGCDIKMLKKALDRCAFLMKTIAGGQIFGKLDIYPKIYQPFEINLRYEKVNNVLGINLLPNEIDEYLRNLCFEIVSCDSFLKVKPPSFRGDIKREIDLIEEIARLYGYDRIPAKLPQASICLDDSISRQLAVENKLKDEIRLTLFKSGFSEVINFSFMGAEDIEMLKISTEDPRRKTIKILNPLRIEDSYMRTTLLPSLLKNVLYNISHGNKDLRLFEISRVFIRKDSSGEDINSKLPQEIMHLALIYYREKAKNLYKEDIHEFYLIKGVLESILQTLRIKDYSFLRTSEPFLHPGQSSDLFVSGFKSGFLGVLNPTVTDSLNIKAYKPQICILELNIEALIKSSVRDLKYKTLSRYPYIERDTAIIVDASLDSILIKNLIAKYPTDLIEDSYLFDVYQGANIPKNKKSLAFNIRYRATDKTLKDEEVDILHNEIVKYILQETKGHLRA